MERSHVDQTKQKLQKIKLLTQQHTPRPSHPLLIKCSALNQLTERMAGNQQSQGYHLQNIT